MDLLDSDQNLYCQIKPYEYIRYDGTWWVKPDFRPRWIKWELKTILIEKVMEGWKIIPATPEHIVRLVTAKLEGLLDD